MILGSKISPQRHLSGRWRLALACMACASSFLYAQASGGAPTMADMGASNNAPRAAQSPAYTSANVNAAIPLALVPPNYTLGTGDQVSIRVYNMPELNRSAVVGPRGHLYLSYLNGSVSVNGLTARAAAHRLAAALKSQQILLYPQVELSVTSVQSRPIIIIGEVVHPRVLQEYRPITLLEALIQAGGPAVAAGNTVLVTMPKMVPAAQPAPTSMSQPAAPALKHKVASPAHTRQSFDSVLVTEALPLAKVLQGTNPKYNVQLHPGDYVRVLPGGQVFAAGAFNRPGAYPISAGQTLTVANLVSLTHGWQNTSNPGSAVLDRPNANGNTQVIPLNLSKIMDRKAPDLELYAGDILYVPSSTKKTIGLYASKGFASGMLWALSYYLFLK